MMECVGTSEKSTYLYKGHIGSVYKKFFHLQNFFSFILS